MLIKTFLRFKEYWHVVERGISTTIKDADLAGEIKKVADQRLKDIGANINP